MATEPVQELLSVWRLDSTPFQAAIPQMQAIAAAAAQKVDRAVVPTTRNFDVLAKSAGQMGGRITQVTGHLIVLTGVMGPAGAGVASMVSRVGSLTSSLSALATGSLGWVTIGVTALTAAVSAGLFVWRNWITMSAQIEASEKRVQEALDKTRERIVARQKDFEKARAAVEAQIKVEQAATPEARRQALIEQRTLGGFNVEQATELVDTERELEAAKAATRVREEQMRQRIRADNQEELFAEQRRLRMLEERNRLEQETIERINRRIDLLRAEPEPKARTLLAGTSEAQFAVIRDTEELQRDAIERHAKLTEVIRLVTTGQIGGAGAAAALAQFGIGPRAAAQVSFAPGFIGRGAERLLTADATQKNQEVSLRELVNIAKEELKHLQAIVNGLERRQRGALP